MSLLQHLRLYHGDWMLKREELNALFASRPPLPFTVYPVGDVITARPVIAETLITSTLTRVPGTDEVMPMVNYYHEKLGYRIHSPNELAIHFDIDPTAFYPAELIYIHDIETCMFLPNRFTIVV